MAIKGNHKQFYAYYEELSSLRVAPDAEAPCIYKRLDKELQKVVEHRKYQIRIPIPNVKNGIRKSLGVSDRTEAIRRAEDMVIDVKVQLKQGGTVLPFTAEKLVHLFLQNKKALIRGRWQSKHEGGDKSITQERYVLIEGKLRNYFLGFLGKNTDVRNVPLSRWNKWEQWRIENNVRQEMGKPKAITVKNEKGMIREIWNWAMKEQYIPHQPKLPFEGENLKADDKVRRDTWEAQEWSSFARKLRDWLNTMDHTNENDIWDAFVAYQMVFFLANTGLRLGECMKIKHKDIQYVERFDAPNDLKKLCCLIKVHPSTKTGAREVNGMGGEFAKRVRDRSKFKSKNHFLFCHLDGSPFTTKQFREWFKKMIAFTNENERWGKVFQPYALRHFYATTRLQNGTSQQALCENMGVKQQYLNKHYSHYLTRLASDDLMKMNDHIGLGGKIISMGDDFTITDMTA